MIALVLAVALSQAPDAPLANPDAHGKATIIKPGETFTNTGTRPMVALDDQEDVSRERDRVEAHVAASDWKTAAVASIGAGAALTVALVVLSGFAVAHKL